MVKVKSSDIIKSQTGMTVEQIQKFYAVTPPDKIKERPAKGGGKWKYVEGSYVTQVLNSLFGFNWSFAISTSVAEALESAKSGTVVVKGALKVKIGDDWVVREQYGKKEIAFKRGDDQRPTTIPLDFGNDVKAAATDAKKKCAAELGLFADVYSQDNFFEATIVGETLDEERIKAIAKANK